MDQNIPLLTSFNTPYQVPPFSEIDTAHFIPAIDRAIELGREEIKTITENIEPPTFENTLEAMELAGTALDKVASILFNLNAAETSDALQQVAQEVSPKLTSFNNEIKQNSKLFKRLKAVYDQRDGLNLNPEEMMLLEKSYKSFIRSGANLNAEDKKAFNDISMSLSKKGLEFGEHVLAETNEYQLHVIEKEDLKGLPKDVLLRAQEEAKKHGREGWIFTLQAPSYIPFMEYADNRSLRKELFLAYMRKAFKGTAHDNQALVKEIVVLRAKLAKLLGYNTYADFVLEERMAESPVRVKEFLDNLLDKALNSAREEVRELQDFIREQGDDFQVERWDWAYYSEKLKKKKFNLDDEKIKPYFQLEQVIDGVFETAQKLYGLTFRKNDTIPVYHKDVQAYEVESGGETLAIFYADFFPREGKRPGAWMTSFREQYRQNGKREIPIISIVCNFTPTTGDTPSLLKFDEVRTLFHEFGHALHGMLADTKYKSLSGTSVYWDFVELPSQIMENWCYEKDCLDLFARHYENQSPIPQDLVDQIKASSNYHEAYATVRQISFGLLDLSYHHETEEKLGEIRDVEAFEKSAMAQTELFPSVPDTCMSTQFSHIFAGGYAAGYYSYKWAEVLDADAFALFLERGVFDSGTAKAFREHVLSKGGTEHPMELYKKFRGREPSNDALLKRAGLAG